MKSFADFLRRELKSDSIYSSYYNLHEIKSLDLHPDIQKHLDEHEDKPYTRSLLSKISSTAKKLIKAKQDTGLENDKPKKGSSRAVFFPRKPHSYKLDGKDVKSHSVVKIAFHGDLDSHTGDPETLGVHQNRTESDYFAQKQWGIIKPKEHPHSGEYETNHDSGVLAPVFDSHPDNHWIHQGRVRSFKPGEFKHLTKTPEFPKGISHDDFHKTLMYHHEMAHGRLTSNEKHKAEFEHLSNHPFIAKALDFTQTMGQHPGDYNKRNMGVFEHPDGSLHPVISDYGFSHEVAKLYAKARKNKMSIYRQNKW